MWFYRHVLKCVVARAVGEAEEVHGDGMKK